MAYPEAKNGGIVPVQVSTQESAVTSHTVDNFTHIITSFPKSLRTYVHTRVTPWSAKT